MTNYEKIKQMSVEELAEFLNDTGCGWCSFTHGCSYPECGDECCKIGIRTFLESEVEEDGV